jgi:hypothetical protein
LAKTVSFPSAYRGAEGAGALGTSSKELIVKRKTRYEVFTRPDLYDIDRPGMTRLFKIAIVLAILALAAFFHLQIAALFPGWSSGSHP